MIAALKRDGRTLGNMFPQAAELVARRVWAVHQGMPPDTARESFFAVLTMLGDPLARFQLAALTGFHVEAKSALTVRQRGGL